MTFHEFVVCDANVSRFCHRQMAARDGCIGNWYACGDGRHVCPMCTQQRKDLQALGFPIAPLLPQT